MAGNNGNGFRIAFGLTAGAIAVVTLCISTAWAMVQGHANDVNRDLSMLHSDIQEIRGKVDALWRERGSPAVRKEEK